jgi:phage internal scaffolding protein
MKFQTAFGSHRAFNLDCGTESMTQQCHAAECDINNILSRFQKTGVIEHENRFQGEYANFLDVYDYHDAMIRVAEANEAFDSLPSSLRAQFNNSPALFLEFVNNPANDQSMIDLGLKLASPIVENVPVNTTGIDDGIS